MIEEKLADPKITALLSEKEIDACLNPQPHLKNIDQIFVRFEILKERRNRNGNKSSFEN
ncbi:MAG: hypothetical protein QME57_05400 [Patescibacteria group bacterium]|nr:hypothetical protein [Patescibacteria group bacterium]